MPSVSLLARLEADSASKPILISSAAAALFYLGYPKPCCPPAQLVPRLPPLHCLQYCNRGTLLDAIDRGWLRVRPTADSPPDVRAVLLTAQVSVATAVGCRPACAGYVVRHCLPEA